MKKLLVAVGLGSVGVLFALGLTVGALAVAGPDVGEPPTVPVLDTALEPSPTPTPAVGNTDKAHGRDDDGASGKDDDRASPTPADSPGSSPATDDRTGQSGGSDDDSRTEDHESDSGSEDHEEPDDD